MSPLREGNLPAIRAQSVAAAILLPAPELALVALFHAQCSTDPMVWSPHQTPDFQKSSVALKASAIPATKQRRQAQRFFPEYNSYVLY